MPFLEIDDIHATYGETPVLRGVGLALDRGQIAALVGPSGSGKSTVLRVLVGLLRPSRGSVHLDDVAVDYRSRTSVRALRNRCAIVFQQFNLFQNMTALGNVTFAPIRVKGRRRAEARAEAEGLLAKVGLADKLTAYPSELSGGQQQRVAIARALALKPEILLLDEVTSALDPELVNDVLDAVRLLAHEGMTMLIVSHEMAFVREVASKVLFMDEGRVIEAGSPAQIFDAPQQQRTRDFMGKILRH